MEVSMVRGRDGMLVLVNGADRIDHDSVWMGCTKEVFMEIETILCQIPDRTARIEPQRIVHSMQAERGVEAWYQIVRGFDQRNT